MGLVFGAAEILIDLVHLFNFNVIACAWADVSDRHETTNATEQALRQSAVWASLYEKHLHQDDVAYLWLYR